MIGRIFRRAIAEIGAKHYTPEQAAAWAGDDDPSPRLHARLSDGRLTLVAVDDTDTAIAFGDLEADGHIDFLYASPEAAGKGIVAILYDALEQSARDQHIKRLYTEASEPARRFFLKKGFTVLHRRDFDVRGVAIHNYAMEKLLAK
ncbi:MAG TPA: GNAT family N-acetyltransferase [Rhizomicrobium sp.]|nr:GNAT family N-acetyltransferase [Rhizomicrobium sp.]